jgi:antirestriction protein ArdC
MKTGRDVYTEVTQSIITKLEEGTVPWRKPWTPPTNLVSMKPYRGINVWLLHDGPTPWWLTYRQAQGLGGHVRKGERGTRIIFWRIVDKGKDSEDDEEVRRIPLLRYYTVFNIDQCAGLEVDTTAVETVATAEDIISGYQDAPLVKWGGHRASYSPSQDTIHMPHIDSFETQSGYYSTILHELSHSTGHESRLGRILDTRFASDNYSTEELVAEMSSAYLCAASTTELVALDNAAAYISHWKSKLSEDNRLIFRVSTQGQKAADWIRGFRPTRRANSEAGIYLISDSNHTIPPHQNPITRITTIPPTILPHNPANDPDTTSTSYTHLHQSSPNITIPDHRVNSPARHKSSRTLPTAQYTGSYVRVPK